MENKETVTINLEEYKEFIISQYENGKYKNLLQKQIAHLEHILEIKQEVFLELGFQRLRMKVDTREEQTYMAGSVFGSYFGYDANARKVLFELGFTTQDLLDYINKQWDIQDAEDNEVKSNA